MKTAKIIFPLTAIALSLAGCSKPAEQAQAPAPAAEQQTQTAAANLNESERLAKFFADAFEQDLKRSPMNQSYLGYKWDYDKWNEITENRFNENRNIQLERLAELEKFDLSQLTDQEKLSHQIATVAMQRNLANDEYRHHTYIMHQFRAWHTTVPSFLINIHRVSDVKDAEAYVSRLEGVEPLFDQVIDQLRIRADKGVFPPKWAYDQMIQASRNVISGNPFEESATDSTIWADFQKKVDKLGLTNTEKSGLLTGARTALQNSVLPAYQKMIAELEKQRELSPEGDGIWRLPDGDKWYQNRLNWFTTTDMTADEVHQVGLENVDRIHKAMNDIKDKVGFEGSLPEFFEFMRNDEQFYYPDTDEGREQYMADAKALIDTMETKIPEYFGLTPKARMQVKRVEAFREKSAGKAFYQSPSKDGSRPGTYYANLYSMKDMPTYQMEALAYHEGIPGHHMQRAIAQELEGVPEFQKYVVFHRLYRRLGTVYGRTGQRYGLLSGPLL